MSRVEIEALIIELLAAQAGVSVTALRAELRACGDQLPVDSMLAAAVLADVEARLQVSLPATAESAKALRSVTAFAAAVHALLQEQGRGTDAAGVA